MAPEKLKRLSSGTSGLDKILNGGLIQKNTYLIRGGPGTGKTTLGIHFLCEGIKNKEKSLFISFSEAVDKISYDASQKDFEIGEINFLDLTPSAEEDIEEIDHNVFPSSEVEQPSLISEITSKIKEVRPHRIFFDGITQLYYLATDTYLFRKQIISLIKFAVNHGATVMLSSEASNSVNDDDLQFMCDGVINLEFNGDTRHIIVTKFRGSDFKQGFHSIKLSSSGMIVYPKLDLNDLTQNFAQDILTSGVPELDELLHGGIEKGNTTVISGPTGVGKTTLAVQFAKEASGRGERSVIYTFEESESSLMQRCEGINIPIKKMMDHESLSIVKINPLEYTPDQFAHHIRKDIEENNTQIIILDSISGYLLSFIQNSDEELYNMSRHIHSISEYLKNMGVTLLLTNEVHNITGDFKVSEYGISYLADNIIFLRYLEVKGEMRKAIGVLKKRQSDFEKSLRELNITSYGIKVGLPLEELRGILTGNPNFISTDSSQE